MIFIPGTVKEEAKYERMTELSQRLGLPAPMAHIRRSVITPEGEVVAEVTERSRTWVKHYWSWLFNKFCFINDTSSGGGDDRLWIKNSGGTVQGQNYGLGLAGGNREIDIMTAFSGALNADYFGIIVGTGTAGESFTDYSLSARVNPGVAAGEMTHGAMAYVDPTYNAGSKQWSITHNRVFTNSSGGNITVTESGLHMYLALRGGGNTGYIMMCRDLWSSSFVVVNGNTLSVDYTLTVDLPA